MLKLTLAALLLWSPMLADDNSDDDVSPCRFQAHTTAGTVSGDCATQDLPTHGYNSRWKLALTFDGKTAALARQLKPDQFCDLVRAQSTEDGTDIVTLSLWGDLEIVPSDPEYFDKIKETAPTYETRPNIITISQTGDSPFTLEILFEEPEEYFNLATRAPSAEWWALFQQSLYRLGTNRPDGFSIDTNAYPTPRTMRSTRSPMGKSSISTLKAATGTGFTQAK
jgi:hypothetical protein